MTSRVELDSWIASAFKNDMDYIIVYHDKVNDVEEPVYCKDFQIMHDTYHQNHEKVDKEFRQIIRVYHDGSADENLKLENLL